MTPSKKSLMNSHWMKGKPLDRVKVPEVLHSEHGAHGAQWR